jgi:hypothetical protein
MESIGPLCCSEEKQETSFHLGDAEDDFVAAEELAEERFARSRASISKNSRGNARPMCGNASGANGAWIGFLANTDAPVLATSTSPATTSAVRRRLHNCFFLGEECLKRGGVALPEVVIGNSSPAAVAAPSDGSPAALPPGTLRRRPIHRYGHRAYNPGRCRGLEHYHHGARRRADGRRGDDPVRRVRGRGRGPRVHAPPLIRLRGRYCALHAFHVAAKQGLQEERHGRRRRSRAAETAVGGREAMGLMWEEDRLSGTGCQSP